MNYQFISLRYYDSNFQPTEAQQGFIRSQLNDMATKDDRAVMLQMDFVDGGVDFVLNTSVRINDNYIQKPSRQLLDEYGFPPVLQNGDRRLFTFHERRWLESPFAPEI